MQYVVEKYQGEDVSHIAKLWAEECDPSKAGGGFDMATALRDITEMAEGENSAVFVLKVEGLIVGGLGINVLDMFFTKDRYSAVRYWYIESDYRYLASNLLRHAELWSNEMGCKKMMVCSNVLCHPADEFYLATGYRQYETVYIKDV